MHAILVVDDNPLNRKVASRMVERLGFVAEPAADGHEALAAIRKRAYAAILMDCQMPDLDGYATARRIRRWEKAAGTPDARAIPIVALTANPLEGEDERCRAAGMTLFLSKPVALDDLRRALARVVDGMGDPLAPLQSQPYRVRGDLLDPDKLRSLRKLGESSRGDFAAEVIDLFTVEARRSVAELAEALHRKDAGAACQAAQKFRGSCADVGALSMADLCAQIVEMTSRGDTQFALLLHSLERELGVLRTRLDLGRSG